MDDIEVRRLQPVMDEFVSAVQDGDEAFIRSCLSRYANEMAVMCAAHLLKTEEQVEHLPAAQRRFEELMADNTRLHKEVADLRQRVKDLRSFLYSADANRRKRAA